MEQIVVSLAVALVALIVLAGIGIGSRQWPEPPVAVPRTPARTQTERGWWVCAVCNRRSNERVDQFGQHICSGFGRCALCGYEVESRSGEHFCPPAIARKRLAIEREMDCQRQVGEG